MLKYLRIAVTALILITLPIFGCVDKSSTTPITPSKAKAINAAKEWFNSQGMDPKAAEFRVEPEGTGWSVLIQTSAADTGCAYASSHRLRWQSDQGDSGETAPAHLIEDTMLKYLRIVVTALCLTACVLLIALWVRSYYSQWDISRISAYHLITVHSNCGRLSLNWIPQVDPDVELAPIWNTSAYRANPRRPDPSTHKALGFGWKKYSAGFRLYVPYWFGVFSSAGIGAIPWVNRISWRFSLRTLLIAATLVAIVLGLVAFKLNRPIEQPPIDVGDFGTPLEVAQ